jgi:uncharacterized membrane-anchored protein YhcB (DUF1043 family)
MSTFRFRHFFSLAGVLISLGFAAVPAFGQDAENLEELQRQLETQQKQLDAQQQQLDEQRRVMQELQEQL